jgi:LysM repeat protein
MAVELRRAELEQAKANAQALGQEVPPEAQAPATNPPPPAPSMSTHAYVLGAGETAATVATVFGVPLDVIQAVNPGVNLRRLRPGDSIRIPDSLPGVR